MRYNTPVKIFIWMLIFPTVLFSEENKEILYKQVFKTYSTSIKHKIPDTISEFKTNVELLEALDGKKKRLGFIREVTTSTGCNDGCLPVVFTLFYDGNAKFMKLLSRAGLTKKDHEEFTELDYIRLDQILRKNPSSFKAVGHPSEMVDAITRATLKTYKNDVIARSAYTTLRTNSYNQQTMNFIRKKFKISSKN